MPTPELHTEAIQVHEAARAPHMSAVAAASVFAGTLQLITGRMPSTIEAAASPAVGHVWSLLIILGGVTILVGAWMPPIVAGLKIEASGHVGLATGVLVYLSANLVWMESPWWVSPAVWWPAAFATASVVRWWQIQHLMWRARHV